MQQENRPRRRLRPLRLLAMLLLALAMAALALCLVWCGMLEADNSSLRQQLAQAQAQPAPQASPEAGQPEQRQVTLQTWRGENAVDVYATVTLPPQALRTETMPLVILCHGFTGSREGDGHFGPLALRLAEKGIAALALDFAGCGDSVEDTAAYTLDNMEADVRAAVDYMRTRCGAGGPLGLLGHSMGGRVVSLMLDDTVAAAALWSPANNTGLDGLEFLSHDPAERQALLETARQQGTVELRDWHVTVSSDFLEQMDRSEPWSAMSGYRGALLVAFAAGDVELLSQQTIDGTMQAAASRGVNFTNLYGQFTDATHNYTAAGSSPQADQAVRERIESLTADFFVQALLEDAAGGTSGG